MLRTVCFPGSRVSVSNPGFLCSTRASIQVLETSERLAMLTTSENPSVFLRIATEKRLFTSSLIEEVTDVCKDNIGFPETEAIRRGILTHGEYLRILENYFFHPSVDVREITPDPAALLALPHKIAAECLALPIRKGGSDLEIAMACPDDVRFLERIRAVTKCKLDIRVAVQADLLEAIESHYRRLDVDLRKDSNTGQEKTGRLAVIQEASIATELLPDLASRVHEKGTAGETGENLLKEALEHRATDIHIEPGQEFLTIRFRIDGILHLASRLPSAVAPSLVSRFKVLSNLDIAEKRVPQDGRYTYPYGEELVDCRVSSLPSRWGEKIVLRLLRRSARLLQLDQIQMPAPLFEKWVDLMRLPLGMILVTGPTGSGKTTTLCATIASLDRLTTNIITLEDPIEYDIPGVTQVQINPKAGMTFQAGLRSILRQDPDTVLVGEIRDTETVEIACRAALTGHKIFSTLHTNDSASAITRLLDMGVQPFLLTAALRGILAQRLIRILCPECAESYHPNESELALLGYPKIDSLKRAVGCSECGGMGYKERQAVFEFMVVDDAMQRLIVDRASAYTLREHAIDNGMVPLGEVTRRLVISGKTSLAEGERVVFSDEIREQLCPGCGRVVSLNFAICPYCQHVLKETCSNCKNPIDANWGVCPSCGTEINREWRKRVCSNCLAALEPEWSECPYCGAQQ